MTSYRMFINLSISLIIGTAQPILAAPMTNTCKALVVINGETITQSDLDQRIKLLTLTGGLNGMDKISNNLKAEILKSLIQEKLQLHAAKLKKISITDADVDKALANMAKENNMDLNKLVEMLGKGGVQKETLASRVRAQMAWAKYLRQTYAPLVHVGDSEVDKVLNNLKNRKDQTQYLVSEITLLVSQPGQSKSVLSNAEKIIADLKAGASFNILAQQLSKDASSQRGGDLGWVSLEQVDPAVAPLLQKLTPNSISTPIRTAAGYKIIKVRDVRQAGEADPGETEISLCQVLFPVTPNSTEEELMQVGPQVQATLEANGCAAFKARAQENGFKIQETQKVKLNQMPDHLRSITRTANVGKCVQPAMTPEGLIGTMVCTKKAPTFVLPDRDQVSDDLEQEKLTQYSTTELRKLESKATFDFKDATARELVGM